MVPLPLVVMGGRELQARLCALPGVEACTTTERSVVLVAAPSTDVRLLKGRAHVVCADIGEGRPLEVHAAATPPVPPAFPRPQWALLAQAERPVALATASVLAVVAIALLPVSKSPSAHQRIVEVASTQAPAPDAPGREDAAPSVGPETPSYPPRSFSAFIPFPDGTASGPGTNRTGEARPPATTAAVASKQQVQVPTGLAAASKTASTTRTTAARNQDVPVGPVATPPSATEAAAPGRIETPPPPGGLATELPVCPVTPGPAEAASGAAALAADSAGVSSSVADGHRSREPEPAKPPQSDDFDTGAVSRCIETEGERLKASPQSPPAAGNQDAVDQPRAGGSEKTEPGRRNNNGTPGSQR